MDVYKHPKYYDIAFSYRDIPEEVDFIEDVVRRYSKVPVRRVLELASGNSPHMAQLCRRGYEYVGLEISPEMIAYSRERIRDERLRAQILSGDMRDFVLEQPVDCVLVFVGSLFVQDDDELESHLHSVARALSPGGLYMLDGVVRAAPGASEKQQWTQSSGGVTVDVTWEPLADRELLTLEVDDNGKRERIHHTEFNKRYGLD